MMNLQAKFHSLLPAALPSEKIMHLFNFFAQQSDSKKIRGGKRERNLGLYTAQAEIAKSGPTMVLNKVIQWVTMRAGRCINGKRLKAGQLAW